MVNLDNVTLVAATAVGERITRLPEVTMHRICGALEVAVGCDRRDRPG